MADGSAMFSGSAWFRAKLMLGRVWPAYLALPLLALLNWLITGALALPAWLLWTVCGLGARYFGFLPQAWQGITLPHLAGLFVLAAIVRTVLAPFTAELRA